MSTQPELARRLGLGDAVVIGLGSMIGAGVFAAFGPAAGAAGNWLLAGLAIAAAVAYCNATASAQLAAAYPRAGGTYLYGREVLGDWWGFLAGWGFVVGKTASCAAMAMTFAAYAAPDGWERLVAAVVVVVLALVNCAGITRTAGLTRVVVVLVLVALVVAVAAALGGGGAGAFGEWDSPHGAYGVLQSAGLLFFAFAGYARIATLGEEVRDPARVIPRAIVVALLGAVVVYAVVGLTVLYALGPEATAASTQPLADAVAGPVGTGRCPSSESARPWPPPVRCWRSWPAWGARPWRWLAKATCRGGWTPCTRGSGCHTAPSSPSRPSWWCWCCSWTCVG